MPGEKYVVFRAKTNARLDDIEERLSHHDHDLAEVDADLLTLTEITARVVRRRAARDKLRKIARRRSE
jgi:hypothetical protein